MALNEFAKKNKGKTPEVLAAFSGEELNPENYKAFPSQAQIPINLLQKPPYLDIKLKKYNLKIKQF